MKTISQRIELDKAIQRVLAPKGEKVYAVIGFIQNRIYQFRLNRYYEPHDVFNEAYRRAVRLIENGGVIPNLPAWLKLTALNIVREYSRDREQGALLANRCRNLMLNAENFDFPINYAVEANVRALYKAFQELSQKDITILMLREVHELSWKEIAERVGGNQPALRKQHGRILKRLRQRSLNL